MSCSNGCNAPMNGGSRRVQYGDRRKHNKSRRLRGGFWPFSSDSATTSSLASGEKKGWFSSLFGSSDSSSSSTPSYSSSPSYSFSTQAGGRKRSRAHRSRKHKTRRHKRRH